MLTPSGRESAASVLGRRFVRRPDSTWAMADQLTPEWKASASLVQPRRFRAARTRGPMAPLSLMGGESTASGPVLLQLSVSNDTPSWMSETTTVQSDRAPCTVGPAAEALFGARGEAAKLKRIFRQSRVPMVIVDATRRYVEVNRAACLAFRLSVDELRTLTIDDLTPPHLTYEMEQAWARLLTTGCVAGRHQVARRDGSHFDIVYCGLAHVRPGRQLIAFAPAEWLDNGLDETEDDRRDLSATLTPRETEVLSLAADGLGGLELAEHLVLSHSTVGTHFKNIYEKLNVGNRAAAVAKAMRLGLID
jgi:PAS domain S-box-containing protein